MGQTITPLLGDAMRKDLRECGLSLLLDTIDETVRRGGRSWSYSSKIAHDWKLNGKPNGAAKPAKKDGRSPIIQNDPNATGVTITVIDL